MSRRSQRTPLFPRRVEQVAPEAHIETWLDYLVSNPDIPLESIEPKWARTYVSWYRD